MFTLYGLTCPHIRGNDIIIFVGKGFRFTVNPAKCSSDAYEYMGVG